MIALPHLVFVVTLAVAVWIAFPLLTDRDDSPLVYAQVVLLGLLTGGILTVVIP